MEEGTAAVIHEVAPGEKSAEWHQKGLKRALSVWQREKPSALETILESDGFEMLLEYAIRPDGLGEYGYDTGFHYVSKVSERYVDEVEGGDLADSFCDQWIESMKQIIEEEVEQTLFSPKEYASFFAHRSPYWKGQQAADALGIKVGTYRGKLGRVNEKLERAKATAVLDAAWPESSNAEDWAQDTYSAPLYVLSRVDEDRLPINAASKVQPGDQSIQDVPLEKLILDD